MPILQRINNDKELLQQKLRTAENEHQKNEYLGQLRYINAILSSGVIPKSYKSFITKRHYEASIEEQAEIHQLPNERHVTFCRKQSRKESSNLTDSVFTLFNTNGEKVLKFSAIHNPEKKYLDGAVSEKVKKSIDLDTREPLALKVFRNNVCGSSDNRHRIALRNAICHRLLGRKSYGFLRDAASRKKTYIVSPWLDGMALVDIDLSRVPHLRMDYRVILALSLLEEIKIFHQMGLVNLDIKPDNIIMNDRLTLFDFDSVRNINEVIPDEPNMIYTPKYIPYQIFENIINFPQRAYSLLNMDTDIVALCRTLAIALFPDLFKITEPKEEVVIKRGLNIQRRLIETMSVQPRENINPRHFPLQQLIFNTLNLAYMDSLNAINFVGRERQVPKIIGFYDTLKMILEDNYHNTSYENLHAQDRLTHYTMFSTGKSLLEDIEAELVSYEEREAIANSNVAR